MPTDFFSRFAGLMQLDAATLRRRLLFILGGVVVGLLAVLMTTLADWAQGLFGLLDGHWPWAPLLVTPAGFALTAWLTQRFVPGASGSGIPQVIAARQLQDVAARSTLVSIRLGLAKIALLTLGLAAGASAGREGPTVQVGASTMFFLGRIEPHRQPGLLLAGSAAGIAAAFNAPLAGIIFGIEEMSRSFEQRSSVLVLVTVIAAGLTSMAILGDYTYFGVMPGGLPVGREWLAVAVAALAGGLAGGLFARVLIVFTDGLPGRVGRHIGRYPVLFAAGCGLLVALCGLADHGSIFGTGYAQTREILAGHWSGLGFGPLKWLATALSSISGIPGGIFSPSLAVGAGMAVDLSPLLPGMPIGTLAILCMAAYLSGVVQAPLTSAVIVSEMTADHALILPIMIASLGAAFVSRLVCPEGVYHALAKRILRRMGPQDEPSPLWGEGARQGGEG
ncbi:MAG TPA: chloride channel protein [Devosia sp.]|nr:chloride channel protein [Devosia sp.]